MEQVQRQYVSPKEFVIYGFANGGQCMSYNIITSYITTFFVNVFNIDSKIVSTMLFVEGIWDAINDPLMGSIIDKTRTRWGKLRPYLLMVPLPLALATIALYAGPMFLGNLAPTDFRKVIYMVLTYFLWEFLYTIGDVPFWGLSAAISPNPNDRSKAISSARFISSIVGGIPGLTIPILIDLVNNGTVQTGLRQVFFVLSLITGILGMGLFSLAGIFIKERAVQSDDEPSIMECIKGIGHNRPLQMLILKDMLGALGDIGGVFGTYYFVDVLGSASVNLVAGIPGTILGFVSYLMLPLFKKRWNNKQILLVSKGITTSTGILKFLVAFGGKRYQRVGFMLPVLMIESIINNLMNGANAVVPTEMIGETVDYAEWTTGQRTEGISFSVLTFVGKFKGAIGRSLGTMLIPVIGYKTSNESAFIQQSEKTKLNIFAMVSIIPQLLGLLGFIPILFYDLVGEKRDRMFRELSEIRKEKVHAKVLETSDGKAKETQ